MCTMGGYYLFLFRFTAWGTGVLALLGVMGFRTGNLAFERALWRFSFCLCMRGTVRLMVFFLGTMHGMGDTPRSNVSCILAGRERDGIMRMCALYYRILRCLSNENHECAS